MDEVQEIKNRLPIEQVIGSYVPLKKAGRLFKACCPFHSEKTPSFTVSPERGIFKCFGCNEGGDIFDFVMKIDGLTFPEALTMLAERAGVTLPERSGRPAKSENRTGKERLFKLNQYAAKLWHSVLLQHPKSKAARQYLERRGLTTQSIALFQIGYAPPGPATNLALKKAGFSPKEIAEAGEPGRFQDRITFPIADSTGRIVGFTGRLLELPDDPASSSSRGPKYWNTPETPVFLKSRAVYALHLAKQAIQKEKLVILAEGQMDVVMLHQSGYSQAVASSGTALTPEQVSLLGRFATNLVFAYDQDKAGIEAVKRGAELVLEAELNPLVISVPEGKDPAECLQKSPKLWEEAYRQREPFISWLTKQLLKEDADLTPTRKKELARELLPWLERVKDPLERGEWLQWLSVRLQTDPKNLQAALSRLFGGEEKPTVSPSAPPSASSSKAEVALALLLAFPEILPHLRGYLPDLLSLSPTPYVGKMVPLLQSTPEDIELKAYLEKTLSLEEQKELAIKTEVALTAYEEELNSTQALADFMLIASRLRSEAKEAAKQRLAQAISLAQQEKDSEKVKELFAQLKNLI